MCCFRWCGRQLCLRNMPISGVNLTPRTTAVYASDPALPRRPQDSLPPCLLGFGRTRLALASSYRLLLSHPASGSRTRHHAFSRVTPSAVTEHFSELLGCPISRSLTTVPRAARCFPEAAELAVIAAGGPRVVTRCGSKGSQPGAGRVHKPKAQRVKADPPDQDP